jgi:excisionase family DNA binding protein
LTVPDGASGGLAVGVSCVSFLTPGRLYTPMRPEIQNESIGFEPLLDADEVAERLGVNPRFVRRLVEERRIPFCKLGKFVRFRPTDVRAWLAECVVEPNQSIDRG